MFTKVLVAEDYEIANQGIIKVLEDKIGIEMVQESKYCDEAFLKFHKSQEEKQPFQLVITDLSFKEDYKVQLRKNGMDLIKDIQKINAETKIIVYSQEDRPNIINMLFDVYRIHGYVCKGQNAVQELIDCIKGVYQGKIVYPPQLQQSSEDNLMIHLDEIDMLLLEELSNGMTKKEIRTMLKKEKITPNSESYIDKRVSKLFDDFKAKNTTHLIGIVKDLGLL